MKFLNPLSITNKSTNNKFQAPHTTPRLEKVRGFGGKKFN